MHSAGHDEGMQLASLAILYRRSHGEPLLPNLAALYWGGQRAHDVLDILTLVSASLRELHISETGQPQDSQVSLWSELFHELSLASPHLETLSLSGNIPASSILCVSELKQLKTLTIINLAQRGFSTGYLPILRSCAALSHLRDFGIKLALGGVPYIAVPGALEHDEVDPEHDFAGFHSLRSLRVHGSLSLVSRFLAHVSSPELASLDALLPLPGRWEDFRACLDTLAARFAPSLRVVRLSGSWTGDLASLARPMVVLGALLHLPHLEELAVISYTGVALPLVPADVDAMAKAWPRLRELKLLYQPVRSSLPIDALAAFAVHCPDLRTLWLASVDLRGAALRELEACPATDHALEQIWLSGSVGSADMSYAARFIDRMFPHVDPRPMALPWHPCQDQPGWERLLVSLREAKDARLAARSVDSVALQLRSGMCCLSHHHMR
ncbi:hypothetical protein BD414DRAFT_491151 [Trametes punicea]|nr:hypothetical protein BD414DRAFT_491151 [Trametes punicea]